MAGSGYELLVSRWKGNRETAGEKKIKGNQFLWHEREVRLSFISFRSTGSICRKCWYSIPFPTQSWWLCIWIPGRMWERDGGAPLP